MTLFTSFAGSCLLCLLASSLATGFWSLLLISTSSCLFASSGILDAYCLDLLGKAHRDLYGSYRMWCALSWGLGSFAMGVITDKTGKFEWNFILYATFALLSLALTAAFIPARTEGEKRAAAARKEREEREKRGALLDGGGSHQNGDESGERATTLYELVFSPGVFLNSWRNLLFLTEITCMGAAVAIVERLLFVYVTAPPPLRPANSSLIATNLSAGENNNYTSSFSGLGGSTTLCGGTIAVTVLFEFPIFIYAPQLLHFPGRDSMLLIAMLAYAVRTYGCKCVPSVTKTCEREGGSRRMQPPLAASFLLFIFSNLIAQN